MKFWITKYALTSGIKAIDGEIEPRIGAGQMITNLGNQLEHFHGEGRDWHRTREAAVTRAKEMRRLKIAALEKQIARIKKLDFNDG